MPDQIWSTWLLIGCRRALSQQVNTDAWISTTRHNRQHVPHSEQVHIEASEAMPIAPM